MDRRPYFDPLDERHSSYAGLGSSRADWRRGHFLARHEPEGLVGDAVPYAVEALQSGQQAYVVAAGAKALRGSPEPAPWMIPLVDRALQAVRRIDDTFSFDAPEPQWPPPNPTTAVRELTATREWLLRSVEAPTTNECCQPPALLGRSRGLRRRLPLDEVVFEDQDARQTSGRDLLTSKPSVLAFFYTRCSNPAKCSLTMTRLAHLQDALAREAIDARVLAATYDPAYDTPERLRAYAVSRGYRFGDDSRVLRAVEGMDRLSDALSLGVNYGQVTVNLHRIELFVLDARGRVRVAFTRLQWNVEDVVEAVRAAAKPSRFDWINRLAPAAATPAAVVAAFVPHCPFCWSAYATAAGVPGLAIASPAWLHRGAWLLLGVNALAAVVALRRSRRVLSGVLMLAATSALAAVATLPVLASSRGLACAVLAVGFVIGLRRTRSATPARAGGA